MLHTKIGTTKQRTDSQNWVFNPNEYNLNIALDEKKMWVWINSGYPVCTTVFYLIELTHSVFPFMWYSINEWFVFVCFNMLKTHTMMCFLLVKSWKQNSTLNIECGNFEDGAEILLTPEFCDIYM